MTPEEKLTLALSGIPDEVAPDAEGKRNAWSVCSYVLVKMLHGLGDLAPNRFTYTFDYGESENYEITVSRWEGQSQLAALESAQADLAALRIEHAAWGALLDVTRKDRDALRARVAELDRLQASIHKAADTARKAERADVVAHPRTVGRVAGDYADAIEAGEHEGAAGGS